MVFFLYQYSFISVFIEGYYWISAFKYCSFIISRITMTPMKGCPIVCGITLYLCKHCYLWLNICRFYVMLP